MLKSVDTYYCMVHLKQEQTSAYDDIRQEDGNIDRLISHCNYWFLFFFLSSVFLAFPFLLLAAVQAFPFLLWDRTYYVLHITIYGN